MGWIGRMGRTGRATLFAAAFLSMPAYPALPAPPAQDQSPSFRSASSELVVLPVVVTDRQNRYISDLARERFVVFDNGRKMPIELFTNEDSPATIALSRDASSSIPAKL